LPFADVCGRGQHPWSCGELREAVSRQAPVRTARDGECGAQSVYRGAIRRRRSRRIVAVGAAYLSTVSRPYLRSRPYNCVRVSPSRFAARDLLPCVVRMTCSIV
jgi:hypothetical protein